MQKRRKTGKYLKVMALSPAAEGGKPIGCEHYQRKSKFVVSSIYANSNEILFTIL